MRIDLGPNRGDQPCPSGFTVPTRPWPAGSDWDRKSPGTWLASAGWASAIASRSSTAAGSPRRRGRRVWPRRRGARGRRRADRRAPAGVLARAGHGRAQGRASRLAGREGHRARGRPAHPDRRRTFGRDPSRHQARPSATIDRRSVQAMPAGAPHGPGRAGRMGPACGGVPGVARSSWAIRRALRAAAGRRSRAAGRSSLAVGPEGGFTDGRERAGGRGAAGCPSGWGITSYAWRPRGWPACAALLARIPEDEE